MSQQVRESQRVPRSCTECSRRKIRCSKTIPCSACVRRGEVLLCVREVVRVNGRITVALDTDSDLSAPDVDQVTELRNANRDLQARIEYLEGLLLHQPEIDLTEPGTASSPVPASEFSRSSDDILSTFQGLHLEPIPKFPPQLSRKRDSLRTEYLFSLLPTAVSSEKIVRFSLENLGWIHCALNSSVFLTEHEKFWKGLQAKNFQVLEDHGWIALYLSIISVGVYFMDERHDVELHFLHESVLWHRDPALGSTSNASQTVSRAWYDAVLKELNYADFLGKPTLCTIQTLAILNLIHRNLGEAEREYILLAVAINTAKSLQMDLLGREDSLSPRVAIGPYWKDRTNRDLGRRLWWTLVICDWMMMPIRPSLIGPGSFTSALSIEADSSHRDIILSPSPPPNISLPYFPEPLAYHIFVARIASIVRPYRDRSMKISVTGVCRTLQALDSLTQALPPHLSITNKDAQFAETSFFPWIKAQRSLVVMLLSVCRINVCLLALVETLETGEDPFDIRGCGRRAAATIVEHRRTQTVGYFSKLWGQHSCFLSAAIYLALDIICFHSTMTAVETESQIERISFVLRSLQQTYGDLDEGSEVLKRLLHIYHRWPVRESVQRQNLIDILAFVANPGKGFTLEDDAPSTATRVFFDHPDLISVQQQSQQLQTPDIPEPTFDSEFSTGLSAAAFEFLPHALELDGEWPEDAFTNTLSWQQMF